mmetsp:Transcript_7773/g.20561  ORF Transcript_7773/g.20561 Transcript_7773/m.20561 type:complete len:200 (+) Transcript_7773:1810-2409(+)
MLPEKGRRFVSRLQSSRADKTCPRTEAGVRMSTIVCRCSQVLAQRDHQTALMTFLECGRDVRAPSHSCNKRRAQSWWHAGVVLFTLSAFASFLSSPFFQNPRLLQQTLRLQPSPFSRCALSSLFCPSSPSCPHPLQRPAWPLLSSSSRRDLRYCWVRSAVASCHRAAFPPRGSATPYPTLDYIRLRARERACACDRIQG